MTYRSDFDLEEIYYQAELLSFVRKALSELSEREQYVIERYFGLGGEEQPLSEIAKILKRNLSVAIRSKSKGLRQLRHRMPELLYSERERRERYTAKKSEDNLAHERITEFYRRKERVVEQERNPEVEAYRQHRKANPDFARLENGSRILVLRNHGVRVGFMSKEVQGCRNEILDNDSWTISFLQHGDTFVDEVTREPVSDEDRNESCSCLGAKNRIVAD